MGCIGRSFLLALALTGTIVTLHAQDADSAEHGVARISIIGGDVTVQRGDSGEQTAAVVNAPLMAGDVISTAPGARVEIQFDSANVVRLASSSEVRLSELTNRRYQLQVARGTIVFSVVRDTQAQIEISTPSVSVRPTQRGAFRITVFEDGRSEITPRAGEAEVYGPRGVETLRAGSSMEVRGNPSDPEFQIAGAVPQDDFDRWNAERDQNLMRSRSYAHVNPEIYGTDDLDAHGHWVNVPEYGEVWAPTVGPDWAPYRYGRWVWEDWYGWTWVSYDPWGWAPFHYGRWFWGGGYGWCWWPGPAYVRPFWSPALVAFFGFGGFHVGVGFGGPGFAWVPLAPFETSHPWWGRGFYGGFRNQNVLVNNINVVNNVNIVNTYRNARVANGVTAVNASDFARGRFTAPLRVTTDQLRQASVVKGPVPVAPTSSSLRFSERPVTSPAGGDAFNNGRFFSRTRPGALNRVPFAQQQQSLAQINRQGSAASGISPGGRGEAVVKHSEVRANEPAVHLPANAGAAASPSTGVWRRFGSSPQAGNPAQPQVNSGSSASGWGRFGSPTTARPNAMVGNGGTGWRTPGDRPATATPSAPQRYQSVRSDGWRRFQPPAQPAPRSSSPEYHVSPYSNSRSLQIAPPIVRERSMPSYNTPRSVPSYSGAVRSAPARQAAAGGSSSHGGAGGHSGGSGHSSGSGHSGRH